MMKKILIIGISLLVVIGVVIGGCVFAIRKIGPTNIAGAIIMTGTGIPTYLSNTILPPPNITKKTDEEKKEILIKLLTEIQQSLYYYQVSKASELEIKIVRMGTPIIPVLIELFRDEAMDKRKENIMIHEGSAIKGMSVIRKGAAVTLVEIIETKRVPLEKRLQEMEATEPLTAIARGNMKRYYKYVQRIEIDMDKLTGEMIDILLSDEDSQTKGYASEILGAIGDRKGIEPIIRVATEERLGTIGTVYKGGVELLKKTGDKQLAKALDQDGADYGLWVWADRDKAINIAMDVLRDNYNPGLPFKEREKMWVWKGVYKEEEIEEKVKKSYAIKVLGQAKAKEASGLLLEMLNDEESKEKYYWNIIEALQKMGVDTINKGH